jgi:hypothetical protein
MWLSACGGAGGTATPPVPGSVPASQTSSSTRSSVANISISTSGTPAIGTPGTYRFTIVAKTSGGVPIEGRYATPIVLTDSDTSGATHLNRTSISASEAVVSLSYDGRGGSVLGGFSGASIVATSGAVTGSYAFLNAGAACVALRNIGGYYPCDLQSAYSLPSGVAGAGQTVAVVDAYDDPNAEEDLKMYRSEFGLPQCSSATGCFRKVNQAGIQHSPPQKDRKGWSLEVSLDLDMVSAICPNCHIILVEANSDLYTDLGESVDAAARLGATQISNSYGGIEYLGENDLDKHYRHPHAMVVVSSGDRDFGVEYPAASPYVTAVGGTTLSVGANGRGWNETVWNNEDIQGSSSGCSAYETKPAWQTDLQCPRRMVADVSAVADPFTGVAVYDSFVVAYQNLGGWETVGGTSAATPIIAGVYALGGERGVSLNDASRSYAHADALNDIVDGNNGGCGSFEQYFCTAEVGYDGPTGNGTPNGTGAFGGRSSSSTRSDNGAVAGRRVPRLPVGTRTIRACTDPLPGHFACDAIFVRRN